MNTIQIILKLIEENNITQYKLSVDTGISSGLISDWVAGRKDPSLKNALKIADYFNCSIDYLVGRTDKREVNR